MSLTCRCTRLPLLGLLEGDDLFEVSCLFWCIARLLEWFTDMGHIYNSNRRRRGFLLTVARAGRRCGHG